MSRRNKYQNFYKKQEESMDEQQRFANLADDSEIQNGGTFIDNAGEEPRDAELIQQEDQFHIKTMAGEVQNTNIDNFYTTKKRVNVRKEPSLFAGIETNIPMGTKLNIVSTVNTEDGLFGEAQGLGWVLLEFTTYVD